MPPWGALHGTDRLIGYLENMSFVGFYAQSDSLRNPSALCRRSSVPTRGGAARGDGNAWCVPSRIRRRARGDRAVGLRAVWHMSIRVLGSVIGLDLTAVVTGRRGRAAHAVGDGRALAVLTL